MFGVTEKVLPFLQLTWQWGGWKIHFLFKGAFVGGRLVLTMEGEDEFEKSTKLRELV